MLTMDDMLAIVKPHNDKLIAEGRAELAERKLVQWQWRQICDRPDWDHQPMRQFIRVEGERVHSGERWLRIIMGTASVERDGPFGYREKDIIRLCEDGDMDFHSAEVTHWMPAVFPAIQK